MTDGMKPSLIGRFFAEEWQQALKNEGSFYTPIPNGDMSFSELYSIRQTLSDLVAYWDNQIYSNTNQDAILNSQAIRDLQQSKLDTVNSIIELKEAAGQTPTATDDQQYYDPNDPLVAGKKDYTLLIIAGAGIGAYLLLRKKKGGKKVTGKDDSKFLLPLLLGAGVVYYFANKKVDQVTQQPIQPAVIETALTADQLRSLPATDSALVDNPGDLPLGSGGTVYIDQPEDIYNETINYV